MCAANCGLPGPRAPKSLTAQPLSAWQNRYVSPHLPIFFGLISWEPGYLAKLPLLHYFSASLRSYCVICDLVPEGEAVVVLRQDTIQTPGSSAFF